MDFSRNETQRMIAQTVRDFCDQHIRPHIMEWDEDQTFPVEAMKKLGELGLMGILVPEEYGGSGLGYDEYVTAITELGRVDPSVALSMAAHNHCVLDISFSMEAKPRKRSICRFWQAESGSVLGA